MARLYALTRTSARSRLADFKDLVAESLDPPALGI
jgi:hypothetical protein